MLSCVAASTAVIACWDCRTASFRNLSLQGIAGRPMRIPFFCASFIPFIIFFLISASCRMIASHSFINCQNGPLPYQRAVCKYTWLPPMPLIILPFSFMTPLFHHIDNLASSYPLHISYTKSLVPFNRYGTAIVLNI